MLTLIPSFLYSQNTKMGIIAQPQVTWMKPSGSDNLTNQGSSIGFDVGLSIEKYFADNYAFLTGVSLNNIGGNISYADSVEMEINEADIWVSEESDMTYNLQYVRVPLALKFKTNEIGYLTYFAQIGFEGGVNVKSVVTINDEDVTKENVSKEVTLFNAGYLIGAGVEYSLGGNTCIILGLQYQNGIIDAINTTKDKVITPKVSLLFGIMF